MEVADFAEQALVGELLVPYLMEHWDDIDRPEPGTNYKDGRLTHDELKFAFQKALKEERPLDSWIIGEVLRRYSTICRAYEDGYWWKEEPILGISQDDLEMYEKLVLRKGTRPESTK